jgi:hypothetical protein
MSFFGHIFSPSPTMPREFYAGRGNDCRRALELARVNVANRPTRRAVKQERAIAAIAAVASKPQGTSNAGAPV